MRFAARYAEAVQTAKTHPRGKGRPKADDPGAKIVAAAKARAEAIKNSAFALGKAPEHLTENQQTRIAMIAENNSRLYRAYRMKETLRLLLKIKDVKEAEAELDRWLWWASHSRISAFKELYKKIKLIIRKAYAAFFCHLCGAVITLFPDILRSLLPGNFQGRGNRAFFPAPAAACGDIGGHKKKRCGIPGWGPSAPLFVSLVFELAGLPAPQLLPVAAVHL